MRGLQADSGGSTTAGECCIVTCEERRGGEWREWGRSPVEGGRQD